MTTPYVHGRIATPTQTPPPTQTPRTSLPTLPPRATTKRSPPTTTMINYPPSTIRRKDHQAPPTTKRCKNQRFQYKHRSNQPTNRRLPQIDAKSNGHKNQRRVTYSTTNKNTLHVVTAEVHQRTVKSNAVKCNVTSLLKSKASTRVHFHLRHQIKAHRLHHHLLHQIKAHRLPAVK